MKSVSVYYHMSRNEKKCAMKPEFSDSTVLQLLSWGTGQNRKRVTCVTCRSHLDVQRVSVRRGEASCYFQSIATNYINEPISKRPKTLTKLKIQTMEIASYVKPHLIEYVGGRTFL